MFRRLVATTSVVLVVVTGSGSAFASIGVGSSGSVSASKGTVDLTTSTADDGESRVYTVHFRGPVTDHGWSYSGTLTGTGSTFAWSASMDSTPVLSVTSDDGTVAGRCVGGSGTADEVTASALHMKFGCVLSRNGSTPWQIALDSVLTQDTNAGSTWTGSYLEKDTGLPRVTAGQSVSQGEVQLGDETGDGYLTYGPLRLSGQIDIGGILYSGDLVSGTSEPVQSSDIPPLAMSGSSNGMTVTGTCSGTYDSQVVGQTGVASSYELDCSLAVGSAAPAAVTLKTVFVTGTGGCSYRDCWGDSSGYYMAD